MNKKNPFARTITIVRILTLDLAFFSFSVTQVAGQ